MTNEDFYDQLRSLTNHPGWAVLCEELEGDVRLLNDISTIKDAEELALRKGQLYCLNRLLSLKSTVEYMSESSV